MLSIDDDIPAEIAAGSPQRGGCGGRHLPVKCYSIPMLTEMIAQ
jgi:hypothetical protein